MTTPRLPSSLGLPDWVRGYRPGQYEAAERTISLLEDYPVVIAEMPTGSGKTLYGELVRLLGKWDGLYLCMTKGLQDQFAGDFPYAADLRGRSNYPVADPGNPLATAADCTKTEGGSCSNCPAGFDGLLQTDRYHCSYCHPWYACPYEKAKTAAIDSQLASTNAAYFLAECNGPGKFRNRNLVVVDEADELEGEIMRFVNVSISERRMKIIGLERPRFKTKKKAWIEWAEDAEPKIAGYARRLKDQIEGGKAQASTIRTYKSITDLKFRVRRLQREIEQGRWVYTEERGGIVFKRVTVDDIAGPVFFQHGQRFVLMSGTIISPEQMAAELGLTDYASVKLDCLFDVDRRPVYVTPAGDMGRKTIEQSTPELIDAAGQIIETYPGERVLIHAVSYRLSKQIVDGLRRQLPGRMVMTYYTAKQRDRVLSLFKRTPGAVLVSPSLERGVDLAHDLCRVVIIAKVPHPNLGDKQVSERLYATKGGDTWYRVQTVRSIVQMTGRGMRAADDWADTYILDRQFSKLYTQHKHLFPSWWKDAVRFEGGWKVHVKRRRKQHGQAG